MTSHVCEAGRDSNDIKEWTGPEPDSGFGLPKTDVQNINDTAPSRQGVRFHKDKEHRYSRTKSDLSERKVGGLSIFKGYESKTVPGRIAYYRHSAVKLQFFRFDERGYVEIASSYHGTSVIISA